MARFRYRMQSILDIKLKMETQAKQEFAAAQQRLNEEEEKLAALQERRTDYERQARQQLLGTLNCRDMAENKEALLRMDEYIAQQHIQIRKAEEKVEQALYFEKGELDAFLWSPEQGREMPAVKPPAELGSKRAIKTAYYN